MKKVKFRFWIVFVFFIFIKTDGASNLAINFDFTKTEKKDIECYSFNTEHNGNKVMIKPKNTTLEYTLHGPEVMCLRLY